MHLQIITYHLALCGIISAHHPPHQSARLPLPVKLVHQFPLPTWIESIAVRSNGNLLLNLLTTPDLYTIDPSTSNSSPKFLHRFPGVLGLFGITEIYEDIVVVLGGNFTLATITSTPGSYSAWTIDFRKSKNGASPSISKIADIKEGAFLNGVTRLPKVPGTVLISDSVLGVVWKLNILTRKYEAVIRGVKEMAPASTSPQLGINGLKVRGNYLYWTNTNLGSLFRARINPYTGQLVSSKIETIASGEIAVDDFEIDERGVVWVATNFGNTVFAVGKDGGRKVVAAGEIDELTVAGDTAMAFGRGKKDKETLYVVTGGALASPVNGTIVEGGKVVGIDTRGFRL